MEVEAAAKERLNGFLSHARRLSARKFWDERADFLDLHGIGNPLSGPRSVQSFGAELRLDMFRAVAPLEFAQDSALERLFIVEISQTL